MSNIMYRVDENSDCFGVPNDFNLASLREDLESDTATSSQRTGTPPFMAMDLQDPDTKDVRHLYRHDLESLFYVLVMFVVRHKIVNSKKRDGPAYAIHLADNPQLEAWFDAKKRWEDLHATKTTFCMKKPAVVKAMIQPDFKCFEPWVTQLKSLFRKGLNARDEEEPEELRTMFGDGPDIDEEPNMKPKARYTEETMGDYITYRTFERVMMRLGRERLKLRYNYDIRP
ncbi:hypothetical protein CPB85DRAFT_432249 [Mucidula mucida]|nr:hypothetical protein CPB85DRAFT_432249 [Mucidula mucida]